MPITNINVKTDSSNSLSVSNDLITRVPTNYSNNAQNFKLVKMENMRDVAQFIGEAPMFQQKKLNSHIILLSPGPGNKVLSVGDSDLSVLRPNNRTNQRFYVDNEAYNSIDNGAEDTIDIKIKLDQESINTIIEKLGISRY